MVFNFCSFSYYSFKILVRLDMSFWQFAGCFKWVAEKNGNKGNRIFVDCADNDKTDKIYFFSSDFSSSAFDCFFRVIKRFLYFILFDKVFRTLRSTTKGVASGHHHLLQKVDENFIFKILSANTSRLPIGNAPTCCLQHRIRWVGKSHPKEDEE